MEGATQGSNLTSPGAEERGPEISTEIVPVPSRQLPAHVWRSGAEIQYARAFRRRAKLDFDWVIAQPVQLTDRDDGTMPFASTEGETGRMQVSRKSVARFVAQAVTSGAFIGQSVALSGPQRARAANPARARA